MQTTIKLTDDDSKSVMIGADNGIVTIGLKDDAQKPNQVFIKMTYNQALAFASKIENAVYSIKFGR